MPGSSELLVYYQRGQIAYLAEQQLKTIDSMISIANYLLDKSRWASKQYRLLEIRNQATKLRPKAKAAVDKALRAGMKKDVDIPDLLTELNSTGQMDTIVRYGKADTELDDIEKDILDYERHVQRQQEAREELPGQLRLLQPAAQGSQGEALADQVPGRTLIQAAP